MNRYMLGKHNEFGNIELSDVIEHPNGWWIAVDELKSNLLKLQKFRAGLAEMCGKDGRYLDAACHTQVAEGIRLVYEMICESEVHP